jgi:hypothetical protein
MQDVCLGVSVKETNTLRHPSHRVSPRGFIIEDVQKTSGDEPLRDCSTWTLRRWISNIGEQLAESDEDGDWT